MSLDDDTTTLGEYFNPIDLVPASPQLPPSEQLIRMLTSDMRKVTARQITSIPALAAAVVEAGWRPAEVLAAALSELAGATAVGDLDAYSSSPGEFAARWNKRTDEERAQWLLVMQTAMEAQAADWRSAHVEIGGQRMTEAQFNDARYPLLYAPEPGAITVHVLHKGGA